MGTDTEIIKKESRINRKVWFHGLAAAFIGGLAAAGSTGAAALTLGDGPKKSLELAAVSWVVAGVTSAFAYLKQSPVPPLPKDLMTITRTEVTETKTKTDSVSVDIKPEEKTEEK